MTTYTKYPLPSEIGQLDGSTRLIRDDILPIRSVNGKLYVRALYPTPKSAFRLHHLMTTAQYADFDTFYQTYSRVFFLFTFAGDNVQYTCCFAEPPQYNFTGTNVDVQVTLEAQ